MGKLAPASWAARPPTQRGVGGVGTKRERAGESLDGGYRYLKLSRMAYYVHKDSYRAEVAHQRRALQEQ